jgi:hypothetical protein
MTWGTEKDYRVENSRIKLSIVQIHRLDPWRVSHPSSRKLN